MEDRCGVWRSLTDGDFEEEDVWEVQNGISSFNSESTWMLGESTFPVSVNRPLPSDARMIPRTSSFSTDYEANNHVMKQQYSKISVNRSDHDNRYVNCEEEYVQSKVPPHEILERRMANSQVSSCSVFEGVGRKLKGRDLSKVRNDVLTKTGFLE